MPGGYLKVACKITGADQSISPAQARVVFFPTDEPEPFVLFLCPGCNDAHRASGFSPELLLQIRDLGASSDWPKVPDLYVPEAA